MTESIEALPSRIVIADISPAPSAEELVAITAALEEGWPRPSTAAILAGPPVQAARWRFSHRRWQHRAVPMQTWGRT